VSCIPLVLYGEVGRLLTWELRSRRRSQIYKRGYVFRRGALVIQMFQQEQVLRDLFVLVPSLTQFSGRPKDPTTHPSARRHTMGSRGQNCVANSKHPRDAPQPINRSSPGGSAIHEGPLGSSKAGPVGLHHRHSLHNSPVNAGHHPPLLPQHPLRRSHIHPTPCQAYYLVP
jgi:hypothetical protein